MIPISGTRRDKSRKFSGPLTTCASYRFTASTAHRVGDDHQPTSPCFRLRAPLQLVAVVEVDCGPPVGPIYGIQRIAFGVGSSFNLRFDGARPLPFISHRAVLLPSWHRVGAVPPLSSTRHSTFNMSSRSPAENSCLPTQTDFVSVCR